ncbi:hypothetical protein ABPG75_013178 [Micractinium tetrahymenae]
MASLLSPPGASRADDYARLLASPAALLPSPLAHGLFVQPAVQEGRLSFDVLLAEHDSNESSVGVAALEGMAGERLLNSARSASHLELFALSAQPKPAEPTRPPLAEVQAAVTQAVVAKTIAAKQQEAAALVAGVAAKYGLAADYGKAEETIKAVWAEPASQPSRASSAAEGAKQQASQQQTAGGEEPTLADQARTSSGNMSCDEEAGTQATSTLKPAAAEGAVGFKRPHAEPAAFTFHVPAAGAAGAPAADAAADDAALKRRRVQYDRMRELEAEVQRVRLLGDALKQSLRQAEAQHEAATLENEQLWNALLHIHASLRAAHAAALKQQVAMHAAAVAAVLPPPQPHAADPSPAMFGLFSPGNDELAAACGMFISPAKPVSANGAGANNKPRKLFLEEEAGRAGGHPSLLGGMAPAELSPALWVQAA